MTDHQDDEAWVEFRLLFDVCISDGVDDLVQRTLIVGSLDSVRSAIANMSRYPTLYRNFRVERRTVRASEWEHVEVDPGAEAP